MVVDRKPPSHQHKPAAPGFVTPTYPGRL